MEIRIACDTRDTAPINRLIVIQDELKELTEENYLKLRSAIIDDGFSFAIHVWESPVGELCILDGTQRARTVRRMMGEGFICPALPIVKVHAASYKEAAQKLLHGASAYGIVTDDGLRDFMKKYDIGLPALDVVEFRDINMDTFKDDMNAEAAGPEEEEIPPPPADPILKVGQLVRLGKHRLLVGDATNADHWKLLMQGEQADLTWTDPPYNVDYEGGTGLKIMNDKMDDNQFQEFLRAAFHNCVQHSKQGAGFYIAHADSEGLNLRLAARRAGWEVKQCLIWVKSSLVMGRQDYQWRHEPILYGWKPGASHHWYSDRSQTTVLEFDKPSRNDIHPTMKPIELVEYGLRNSSKTGQIVIDPFGGSGTTLIAAQRLGRAARMMELDPRYADAICQRYRLLTKEEPEILV